MIPPLTIEPCDVAALPIDAAGLYAAAALLGALAVSSEDECHDDGGVISTLTLSCGWRLLIVGVAITSATFCMPSESDERTDDGALVLGRAVLHVRGADA